MAVKELYSGMFNIAHEILKETADAYTEEQAIFFMSQKLAIKRGVIPQAMWAYLKDNPLSYEIRKVNAQ